MAKKGSKAGSSRGGSFGALQAEYLRALMVRRDALIGELQMVDAQVAAMSAFGPAPAVSRGPAAIARPAGGKKRGRKAGKRGRRAGGGGRRGGRRKGAGGQSLVEALHTLLQGQTMGVSEAAEAVQKAGYKTDSPNFRTIVNQALSKSPAFKKVARGQYTAA